MKLGEQKKYLPSLFDMTWPRVTSAAAGPRASTKSKTPVSQGDRLTSRPHSAKDLSQQTVAMNRH